MHKVSGFSLFEVLISVTLLSLSLMGLIASQLMAQKAWHAGDAAALTLIQTNNQRNRSDILGTVDGNA